MSQAPAWLENLEGVSGKNVQKKTPHLAARFLSQRAASGKDSTDRGSCPTLAGKTLINSLASLIREPASAGPAGEIFKPQAGARLRARLLPFGIIVVLASLAGCRTPERLAPVNISKPGWQLRQGQALWKSKNGGPEIAGDILVATHPKGGSLVQFTKTPLPLLTAQIENDRWQIEFIAEKRSFAGHGPPPAHFIWLHLAAALPSKPLPKELRFTQVTNGGWILENRSSGETIRGFLVP